MSKQHFSKLVLFTFVLSILWIFHQPVMTALNWITNREALAESLHSIGIWGPVALFALLILQVFLAFIPGQALMIACGYLYGFWGGLLLTWTGLFLGGQAAFWLARHYGRPFAERYVSPQVLSKWDKAARGQKIPFYVAALVLPIFPNDAMCYVAGLGKISSRNFLLANMLGRGIACLLASIVGTYGAQIPAPIWALAAVLIAGICIGWKVFNNRENSIAQKREGFVMNAIYAIARFILKAYAFFFHRTYVVSGLENLPEGGKIIALNHTVGCDPLHLPLILDEKVHFLLQDGDFSIPVIGWMLRKTEQIPVYRGTYRAKEALAQACEMLREGKTIVIFPEGKEVPYGERIEAKTGVVRMALETGVPVIPLGIYVPPESLSGVHFTWKGEKCSGKWQVTGKRAICFGSPWKPGKSPAKTETLDIHAETKNLMDQIYALSKNGQSQLAQGAGALFKVIPLW